MTLETAKPSALFQGERQREILALATAKGRVEVADLAERFNVTTETIRRDLSDLQRLRRIRRVHGGAIPWEGSGFEPRVSVRRDQQAEEKRRMANAALAELPERGTIIIDSGSTLTRLAEAIPAGYALRAVTNSLVTAQVLAEHDTIDVIVLGGKVRANTLAMVDNETVAAVAPLNVDTLFISSDAFTTDSGLTTPYREEAALKRAMIKAARRVVALVDHSKFGVDEFASFAAWSDIDVLITSSGLDPQAAATIEATGTTVVLA